MQEKSLGTFNAFIERSISKTVRDKIRGVSETFIFLKIVTSLALAAGSIVFKDCTIGNLRDHAELMIISVARRKVVKDEAFVS